MSRATDLSYKIFAQRVNEAVYVFNGITPGDGASSSPSTKDIEDNLRAKGYVAGREFRWLSPQKLQVKDSAVDRDLLDSIYVRGGKDDIEPPDLDDEYKYHHSDED